MLFKSPFTTRREFASSTGEPSVRKAARAMARQKSQAALRARSDAISGVLWRFQDVRGGRLVEPRSKRLGDVLVVLAEHPADVWVNANEVYIEPCRDGAFSASPADTLTIDSGGKTLVFTIAGAIVGSGRRWPYLRRMVVMPIGHTTCISDIAVN